MANNRTSQKIKQGATKAFNAVKPIAKEAVKAAGKAAAQSVLRAIISSNPTSWYVKYGPVTPAQNKMRPMDPVFNLTITDSPAMGTVPKYIDINVSWGSFFETRSFDLITQKAMQALRKELRSNLPYNIDALRRYLANSVSIAILAKQFERDVHWNLYSSEHFRNFSEAWRYTAKADTLNINGVQNLYRHDYLSDEEWPRTVTLYEQIAFQAGTNIKLPTSLYDFIDHYFNNVFVSRSEVTNAQVLRLRVNELPLVDEDGSVTLINVTNTTARDLFNMIKRHVDNSAIIIADLERSNAMKSLHMNAYDSGSYSLIYDETFLQAIENGYTSTSAVSTNGYIRLDEKFSSSDPLTQFLFMGGVQPYVNGSEEAYFPAFTINSMTIKCYSIPELKWPAGLISMAATDYLQGFSLRPDIGYFSTEEAMYFGINVTTDLSSEFRSNIAITYDTVTEQYGTPSQGVHSYNTTVSKVELVIPAGTSTTLFNAEDCYYRNLMGSGAPTYFYGWIATRILKSYKVSLYLATRLEIGMPSYGKYTVSSFGASDIIAVSNEAADIYNKSAIFFIGANEITTDQVLGQLNIGLPEGANTWKVNSSSARGGINIPTSNISMNADRNNIVFKSITASSVLGSGNPNVLLDASTAGANTWATMDRDTYWSSGLEYSAGYSVSNGIAFIVSYPSPITANVGHNIDLGFQELGLAAYVADNVDVHIPFLASGIYTTVIATNPQTGSSSTIPLETYQIKSSPTLIKETAKPYFYNVLDLEPVLYRMFSSLFSMEVSGRNHSDKGKRDK